MNSLRIGLIEGNSLVRSGRAMLINSQSDLRVVFEEDDPGQALNRASDYLVVVVVVGAVQHGYRGFDFVTKLCEALRSAGNPARVLVSGAFGSVQDRSGAVLAGADEYIGLDSPAKDFLALITELGNPDYLVDPNFLRSIVELDLQTPNKLANLVAGFEEIHVSIVKGFLAGDSDFTVAQRLDISKVRVTRLIGELIAAGSFVSRNQLAIALGKVIL